MRRHRDAVVALGLGVALLLWLSASPAAAVTFTVTNTNNAGPGSLRKAIGDANATVAPDVVHFNIPGAGVHTILPSVPLPQINRPLTINGASEPDFAGSPVIELNGLAAGAADGLRVGPAANASVISALAINRFDRDGVVLASDGNAIRGSRIGTNPAGTVSLGNGRDGVSIAAGAANNTIGGTAPANRNLLSGNARAGLFMGGAGIAGNEVRGNFIGVDASGNADLPNQIGVWISGGAQNNTIGGTTAGARNVISGNFGAGVLIAGQGTQGNAVEGNAIGLNGARTAAVANGTGALIGGGADDNTIGDVGVARNVVSGNTLEGVAIEGAGTTGNLVRGNRIGLNGAGTAAVPNKHGVGIRDAADDNSVIANTVSANTQAGVLVTGEGTANNDVRSNRIGTDPGGTADRGNDLGVHIRGGATGTDVFDNLISGNDVRGVDLGGPGTRANVVRGNLIGLNAAGNAALPNPNGVFIHNETSNNLIGGTTAANRNVISGNLSRGIEVSIAAPTGNAIRGNYIGLNAAGTAAVPNTTGIILLAGATNTTIGGTAAGAGNVISGNAGHGVFVGDSNTAGTVIQGNRIGTNAAGGDVVANGESGVNLAQGANDVQVGGTTAAARNVISGNADSGVVMTQNGTNLRVQGNFIGTDAAGTQPLGNGIHGVVVANMAHDNRIGGKAAGAGNRIANNGGDGVLIGSDPAQPALDDPAGVGNAVLGNRIFDNGGLAIDVGANNGVTANDLNDVDSGPNGLINFPLVDEAFGGGGSVFVSGWLDSLPNRDYRLEFFLNTTPDATGHGEARVFLGARTVTFASGDDTVPFQFTFAADAPAGSAVSATATDELTDSTSELATNEIVD